MKLETAQRLYEYRKSNGYSQEELADKIGVSRQAISKWERSESSPDTDNLIALAELYEVTIDELLNGKKEPVPEVEAEAVGNNYQSNQNWEQKSTYASPTDESFGAPEKEKEKNPWFHALLPIGIVIAYLLLGVTVPKGWACGWLLFFLIPIAETLYAAIKTKNPSAFAFPVLVTAWYLTGGMIWGAWHPQWILLLTSPLYYIGCEAYKKSRKSNAGETYYAPDGTSVPTKKSSKTNNAVAIIGMIICAITIVSVAGIVCTFNFLSDFKLDNFIPKVNSNIIDFDYDDSASYNIGSGEASANGIEKIDIEWISGNITVDYYDGGEIKFTEDEQKNSNYSLRSRTNKDEFQIKYCKPNMKNLPSKDLLIELPQGFPLDKLYIKAASSPVNIHNIDIKTLDIETASGKITADGSFEIIDIDSMSAAANIKTAIAPKSVDIDTMSGNAKITVPPDIAGFKLSFNSMSGNYELNNFDLNSNSKSGSVWGDGSSKINYDSMSGSLTLTKESN